MATETVNTMSLTKFLDSFGIRSDLFIRHMDNWMHVTPQLGMMILLSCTDVEEMIGDFEGEVRDKCLYLKCDGAPPTQFNEIVFPDDVEWFYLAPEGQSVKRRDLPMNHEHPAGWVA